MPVLRGVLVIAAAVFIALTVLVASDPALAADSSAFRIAGDLRAPWLDHVARVVTALGLFFVVAPVIVLGATFLFRRGHRARAFALVGSVALTSVSVWITKALVDRPRPLGALVNTTGQSYPSGHAANAVGWVALAFALTVVIPRQAGRVTAIAVAAVIAALVGMSRIYLRAHYLSDVIAGEALAVAVYAACALTVTARRRPGG